MKILAEIIAVRKGYNDKTIEIKAIDSLGRLHINIVPKINIKKGDNVLCSLYTNLYSVQIESIKKVN